MATLQPTGPNAEQITYWNEIAAPKWLALYDLIDAQIAPLGRRAVDAAALRAGERALDVGCGCGQSTFEIAQRVGPSGTVLGIDISAPMLERARAGAAARALRHVEFANADAQTHQLPAAGFDACCSRFGVMFFSDPIAAFTNLHGAVRPGGRLSFVCWQRLQDNPWMFVPLGAAAQHIALPTPPAPNAPGPFAFADAARVRDILTRAGFVEVALEPVQEMLLICGGAGVDTVADYLLQMGPAAAAIRQADLDDASRTRIAGAVRDALGPFVTAAGVRMAGAAWIVTARRP